MNSWLSKFLHTQQTPKHSLLRMSLLVEYRGMNRVEWAVRSLGRVVVVRSPTGPTRRLKNRTNKTPASPTPPPRLPLPFFSFHLLFFSFHFCYFLSLSFSFKPVFFFFPFISSILLFFDIFNLFTVLFLFSASYFPLFFSFFKLPSSPPPYLSINTSKFGC